MRENPDLLAMSAGSDRWKRRFEALAAFCDGIEWSPNSDHFYDLLARRVLNCTEYDIVCIRRFNVTECTTLGMAFRLERDRAAVREEYLRMPYEEGRMEEMSRFSKPFVLDFAHPSSGDNPRHVRQVRDAGFKCSVMVPLREGGSNLGDIVLSTKTRSSERIDEEELSFLSAIAGCVSTVMEMAFLSSRLVEAGVLEERKRLSTEILDRVRHPLSILRLEIGQAADAFEERDEKRLGDTLSLLEDTSGKAVNLLRDEMALHEEAQEGPSDLVEEISRLLERFERMWGIPARIEGCEVGGIVLASRIIVQVVQVIHEALSNVWRYSRARSVVVSIECDRDILVRIVDDGVGFDPGKVPPAKTGLRIMRERMALVGGTCAVESEEGEGTSVLIAFPRE